MLASIQTGVPAIKGPWQERRLSPGERADLLLAQLTLDEKLILVRGFNGGFIGGRSTDPLIGPTQRMTSGYVPGVPRLGIPPQYESDSWLGAANGFDAVTARPGDQATAMPSGQALSATFEPDLAFAHGKTVANEMRARGINVMLGPGMNLARDPRGGRNFEYVGGEDPLLAGTLAAAVVRGVQSEGVIATLKHYVAHDFTEHYDSINVAIGEDALRESDLLAFELAVEGGRPGAVMCAYHFMNGVRSCHNDFLNNVVLKRQWKWPGYILSDWGAVHGTVGAVMGGTDSESAWTWDRLPYFAPNVLKAAIDGGQIPASRIDDMVRRILWAMLSTGVYDDPPTPVDLSGIDRAGHAVVARHIAERGIVLMKNFGDVLPLASTTGSIAVIGGHADIGVLSGGGSSAVQPYGGFVLIEDESRVKEPFHWDLYVPSSPVKAIAARVPAADVRYASGKDLAAAAALAKNAQIAVVVVNQPNREGVDGGNLELPDSQDALVAAVAAANPNTIVLLQTGNPVLMPWIDRVKAVLAMWYSGQQGGEAVASILFGDTNPSGRLPMTFPASPTQLAWKEWLHDAPKMPVADLGLDPDADPSLPLLDPSGHNLAQVEPDKPVINLDFNVQGSNIGYRWFALNRFKPLFPFGYGLSYTRFRYAALKLEAGATISASFDLSNVGSRAGAELAQVYVVVPGGRTLRLGGWSKIDLEPGEARRVTILIDPRLLASYDATVQRWMVRGGIYAVQVSRSTEDTMLTGRVRLAARSLIP
jgi:beta-glucosidase